MPTEPDIRLDISFEPEQICPAQPGWRAVWKTAKGDYFIAPVVCWAIGKRVSTPNEKTVTSRGDTFWAPKPDDIEREAAAFGLVMTEGYLQCPEMDPDFRGYAGPGEPFE
jgi:hypothetical protein